MMTSKFYVPLIALFLGPLSLSLSAAPISTWSRAYGGLSRDSVFQTVELASGHLLSVGKTESRDGDLKSSSRFGGTDAWIFETDSRGDLVRSFVIGGSLDDQFTSLTLMPDGGFVVAGSTQSNDFDLTHRTRSTEDFDIWVRRYDASFNLVWEKFLGGSSDDFGLAVLSLSNGDLLIGADSESADGDSLLAPAGHRHHGGPGGHRDYFLARLSSGGQTSWVRSFGGTNHEYLSQVIETRDGHLAVYGRTESFDGDVQGFRGEYDGWLVKFTQDGKPLWSRTVGGEMWDWGSNLMPTFDGGVLVSNYFFSWDADGEGNHGDYDYGLVRFDAQGKRLWHRVYGGRVDDFAQGAAVLPDGTYLIAGGSVSNDQDIAEGRGSFDLWIMRVNDKGDLLSSRTYGGTAYDISSPGGSDYDRAGPGNSVQVLRDGGVVISGSSRSNDGDVIGGHGGYDAWLLRLSKDDTLVTGIAARGQFSPLKPLRPKQEPAPLRAPAIEWSALYGGSDNDSPLDSAQAVINVPSGGFAFVASSSSKGGGLKNHGDFDVWVVRTDSKGKLVWQKNFGGSGKETGASLTATQDGGLALIATTDSQDGDVQKNLGASDIWVVKLDANGKLQWSRSLGGSNQEQGWSITAAANGDLVIGGVTYSSDGDIHDHLGGQDFWVARLSSNGELLWSRSLGGPSNDYLTQVVVTPSNDIAVIGRTESQEGMGKDNHGMYDYLLVRLTGEGRVLWSRTYGGRDWEWGNSVTATRDGGFLMSGFTYTFDDFERGQVKCNHGEMDYWLARVDAQGDLMWQQCLGGSNYELAYGVIETSDGGFVVTGGSASLDGQVIGSRGGWDAWLAKVDARGKFQWQKPIGGSGYDLGYSLVETPDQGLLLIGETFSNDGDLKGQHGEEDVFLTKLKSF